MITLEFSGVTGPRTLGEDDGLFECSSLQWGFGRTNNFSNTFANAPKVSDVSLSLPYDIQILDLIQAGLSGEFDRVVDIKLWSHRHDDSFAYLHFQLEDCGITSFSISTGGDNPDCSLSLHFGSITIRSIPFPEDDDQSGKSIFHNVGMAE